MSSSQPEMSSLGCGVGLRSQHYPTILEEWPQVDWFEAITENYIDTGGRPLTILEKIRDHYPIALHGVALSIGSTDLLNQEYLKRLKQLVRWINPVIVSDHICWSGVAGEELHDLLPLPLTEESLRHIVKKAKQVQDALGRQILLENISTYVTYKHSRIPEWEFIREVARQSGCGLLLDVNNVYVNSVNHEFDPSVYLKNIPQELVGQIHVSGHTHRGKYLFDTHSKPVIDPVWALYREALSLWGLKSTLLEWDEEIPPFSRLLEELEKAKTIYQEAKSTPSASGPTPQGSIEVNSEQSRASAGEAPDLEQVEKWMKSFIRPEGEEELKNDLLNPQGGEPGMKRLEVYREGYLARTKEALKEVYETLEHVMGDAAFTQVAEEYAQAFPSEDYNLNHKGRHLSQYFNQTKRFKDCER